MRILVCGDRKWYDYSLILRTIRGIGGEPHVIIDGCASGADVMGFRVALTLGWKYERYPALWNEYGKAAGPIRNQQMIDEGKPELILAFHDDITRSKGTKDMIQRGINAGIKTRIVKHE